MEDHSVSWVFVFHKLSALLYKFFHKQGILHQLLINLHLIRFNFAPLNVQANFFFLPFFIFLPTDRPNFDEPYRWETYK